MHIISNTSSGCLVKLSSDSFFNSLEDLNNSIKGKFDTKIRWNRQHLSFTRVTQKWWQKLKDRSLRPKITHFLEDILNISCEVFSGASTIRISVRTTEHLSWSNHDTWAWQIVNFINYSVNQAVVTLPCSCLIVDTHELQLKLKVSPLGARWCSLLEIERQWCTWLRYQFEYKSN